MIEEEEMKSVKIIEKTDIIAKIGPAIGLMGTLIPLGPGLAALGTGDINTLAQNLLVALTQQLLVWHLQQLHLPYLVKEGDGTKINFNIRSSS